MLITADDLASAVHELDGSSAPLVVSDPIANEKRCPRCHGETTTCQLSIGDIAISGRFLHCAAHGVWMPQDALAATFAKVSRRGHAGAGAGRTYGGAGGRTEIPGASGGMPGTMQSISSAFGGGPADAGLGIATGKGIAKVHTIYVSAFKDRVLACPVCEGGALAYHGDRWACTTCGGSFVENAALRGMIEDITGRPWELPEAAGTIGARACPLCGVKMIAEDVEGVPIDRCADHGVWFDARELAAVLEHAGTAPPPKSVGGWLPRLFRRS